MSYKLVGSPANDSQSTSASSSIMKVKKSQSICRKQNKEGKERN